MFSTVIKRAWSLLLFAVVPVLPARARAQDFPADDDLRLMLRYLVEDGETPGIVLGVLEADGTTRVISYGSPGPDALPLGPRSVFEIGSITKTFTATLLADMAARGEVALDDPVSNYLPADVTVPSRSGRAITLLDLATHMSGLPRVPDNYRPGDPQNPYAAFAVSALYAFLSSHELRRDPGSEYEYSNLGYGLLGHALARAAGTSYRDLLRQRVLEPLGMDMTAVALEGEVAEWMTQGHDGGVVSYWFGTEAMEGAGALRSNAEDMLEYLKANVGTPGTQLERAMRVAHEVRVPQAEGGLGYGFSWRTIAVAGQPPIVTHGGGTGGYSTLIAFDPQRRVGTVLLTNTRSFSDGLGTELLHIDPPPADWRIREESGGLAEYAGEYESTSGGNEYYIRLEDEGYLTYQPEGKVRTRLYAKSDSSFYLLRGPWSFTFHRNEDGEVVGLVMEVDEREPSQAELKRTARKVGDDTPAPAVVAGNAGFSVALGRIARRSAFVVYTWGPRVWIPGGLFVLLALGMLARRAARPGGGRRTRVDSGRL